MPATYTAQHLRSRADRRMVDFDPGTTDATIVDLDPTGSGEGLAIEEYQWFLAGLFRSVGTGTINEFAIIAGTDADLTGATVVVTHALGSAPNAVGDYIWIETDAESIYEVLATATHVGVRVDQATAGDECVIFFERATPTYARRGLTADYIS